MKYLYPYKGKLMTKEQIEEYKERRFQELFGEPEDIDYESEFDKVIEDHKKSLRKRGFDFD